MKFRNLLPIVLLGASLTASAKYPITFRDAGNINKETHELDPQAGGHFNFPIDAEGNPIFNEDGSITATVNEYGEGGIWLRTTTITENCPEEYCIFAFDYKTNRDINNLVVFHHEYAGRNDVDQISGALLSVSDKYQTFYMTFNRKLNNWGFDVAKEKNYLWISSNDANAKREGWEITIKDIRLLTVAEATEECKNAPAVKGDIADYLWKPNADLLDDNDPDMDCTVYTRAENAPNPLLWSANIVRPLPEKATKFAFDYKLTGESFAPNLWLTGTKSTQVVNLEGLGDADPYEAEWKTIVWDLTDEIKATNWGQTFGCGDWLQIQFLGLGAEQMMWIKNPRWINPAEESYVSPNCFPLEFRDAGNIDNGQIVPENGGHFEFALNEDGTPAFNADGSITATVNQYGEGGIWLRTKALTENCPEEYCIFAFDYKTNRDINNIVVFHHEYAGRNDVDQASGALLSVSDDYQTFYMTFNRKLNNWGFDVANEKNYLWISSNDANAKREGWEITIKNIRLLTIADAIEECKHAPAVTGDVADYLWKPNADLLDDNDPDMDCTVYTRAENAPNPLLWSANIVRPLPENATTFAFDYKLTGESFAPNLWLTGTKSTQVVNLEGLGEADPYEAEWKTIKWDLSDEIKATNWGRTFGCGDWLQIQFLGLGAEQMMWIKNPRWINSSSTGIDEITYTPERPADNRIFNLMGIECKGDLVPGIYIQNGKKFIVK